MTVIFGGHLVAHVVRSVDCTKSHRSQSIQSKLYLRLFKSTARRTINVLVTQRIYSRLHSFTQYFDFTAFDMHRFTTLAKKHEGTTRESCDARNTNAGYLRGYHYKSSLFGFSLSLPERVQRAVTVDIYTESILYTVYLDCMSVIFISKY